MNWWIKMIIKRWQLVMHCNLRPPAPTFAPVAYCTNLPIQQCRTVSVNFCQCFGQICTAHAGKTATSELSVKILTPPLDSATPISYRWVVFWRSVSICHVTLTFWPWIIVPCRLWHDQTLRQILAKSNNPRRSYCDFSLSKMGAVRHLWFDRKCFFTISDLREPTVHQRIKYQHNRAIAAELLII